MRWQKALAMARKALALLFIALALSGCLEVPTLPPPATATNTASPLPTGTPTAKPATEIVPVSTAVVSKPVVNVRVEPDGEVVGSVKAGEIVTLLECVDDWCNISTDVLSGWVWRGCLSDNPDKLGCEAR